MSNPWFRLYHSLLDNPKVQRLEPELFKIWINFLCAASRKEGEVSNIEDLAFALRMSVQDCKSSVNELVAANLIERDGLKLIPHDWNELQFTTDTSKARMRAYRDRMKSSQGKRNGDVTRDVTVTSLVTAQEQIQNRTDTEQSRAENTKTRTKARVVIKPSTVDARVWEDFKTLRSKLRAAITETVILGIEREAILANVTLNDALRTCCERGWRSFKAEWVQQKLIDPKGRVSPVTMKSMNNLQEYLHD